MLISISLSGKLLSTWHFPEKVNNKPFTLSGFAVISRFSRKTRAFLRLQNSICFIIWLIGILESGCFMFYAKYLFLWTLLCRCVNRLHHNQRALLVQIIIIKKKSGGGDKCSARALSPLCFQVGAMCCTLLATARTQQPVLHAGSGILINLEDDSATLDDDSSTLIRNEATEPPDKWRGRKCASVWLMK